MNAVQRYGTAVVVAAVTITGTLVGKWEPARDPTVAYLDPVGVATICDGHTRGVRLGMRVSMEQCAAWRAEDIAEAMDTVAGCITWPLTSNQLGAIADGVVNLGPKLVCGSTLQRKANAGDMQGACRELTEARNSDGGNRGWSFAGGRFFAGLFARRTEERWICWPDFRTVVAGVRIRDGP